MEVPVEASFGGADYRDSFMEKQTGGKQFQVCSLLVLRN